MVAYHSGFQLALAYLKIILDLEMLRHIHAPRSYHLLLVGTDTAIQGLGVGTEIVQRGLPRADEEGVPSYLESSNPRSHAFYHRLGFKNVHEYHIGGDETAPVLTLMRRNPEPVW
mmetsp:Transcript_17771/g.20238  ORF Transcript_17771/g.20238 Transcript_17771/m.20238 type:complete len:115 (+) Transcript_17771:270-614(+)